MHSYITRFALKENNSEEYGNYQTRSKDITSRILISKKDQLLTKSEIEFDVKRLERMENNSLKRTKILFLILALSVIVIVLLTARLRMNRKKYHHEIIQIRLELEKTIEKLKEEQKHSSSISELVRYRISALNDLYQDVRIKFHDENRTKKIIPISHLFKAMNEKNEILNIELSDSFWEKMKISVDGEYYGIVSFVENHYPHLAEHELHLFCLLCANISPQIIKLCMNYTNAKTVSNYRKKLIRKMTGKDMSFDQFIQQYLETRMNE